MGIKLRVIIQLAIASAIICGAIWQTSAATETNIVAVDSGAYAHFALASDGTVWAWGNNMYGQMGDVAKETIYIPFKLPGLTGVKAISSDGGHTVILKEGGSVWAAGKNDNGQLGDGTQSARTGFVQCKGLGDIIEISANDNMALALKNDGTVWAWGYYAYGSGSDRKNVTTPEKVGMLSGIKAISAGVWHYLAVDGNGEVWGWGNNINGQLGKLSNPQQTPAKISGISGVKAVSAGYQYSLFLKNDGTVWALGWNYNGLQGTGQNGGSATVPTQVPGLSGIVQIAAAQECATALKDDGTIYIWGYSNPGGFGIGKMSMKVFDPTPLPYMTATKAIAARSGKTLLALQKNGTVFGMGSLWYKDPDTGYSVNTSQPNLIKFVTGSQQATPTKAPGATTQPTAAPTQTSSGSGNKTPAPSAFVVIGILSAVAIFAMRKK